MPKKARSDDQVQKIRRRILDEAVGLITTKGFTRLSMRAIAAPLGMTAANIYNYYQNKDELYLDIQTRGFKQLYELLQQAIQKSSRPEQQIKAVIRAYLEFGFSSPSLYEIMFTLNTPKYSDYKHTSLEPIARIEKETALQSARLVIDAITDLPENFSRISSPDVYFRVIQTWTALHGIVSLYNSRVLQEIDLDTRAVIDRCVEEYSRYFSDNLQLKPGVSHE
ncbi:MAG: TetR/AcrR family transcriptional regulator [Desulfosudaceae bacterium]